MNYRLPEIDLSTDDFLFCGKGKRKATATDIIFINPDLIAVASFLGKKIYLINIKNNRFEIVDEIDSFGYVDLMSYNNGILGTANNKYKNKKSGYSLFSVENNKITHINTIEIDKDVYIHGILFVDDERIILSSSDVKYPGLYFLNLKSNNIYKHIKFDLKIKDICFYKDKLLVLGSETLPSESERKIKKSIMYQYNFETFELINTLVVDGQADSICVNEDDGFITLQCEHSVVHFKFKDGKPTLVNYIKGFDFPHGVEVKYNKFCVTNYGTNSVDILNLNDVI